jgi:MOSC domain-containing protein YiiM
MIGAVKSLQVALPRLEVSGENAWQTGIFKTPTDQVLAVGPLGLEGDGVGDTVNHGGPDKAVCCHPWVHYEFWNAYFDWDLALGAFGENLTLLEVTEATVAIGDIWALGSARFQVSQPRTPCWKQSHKLGQVGFEKLTLRTGRSGFYLRVLEAGQIKAGDSITLLERPHPKATIVRLNRAMLEKDNLELAEAFASLPALATGWRKMFANRLA